MLRDLPTLCDTGSEASGVIGWELVPKELLVDAPVRFNLACVQEASTLEGGRTRVYVTTLSQSVMGIRP